MFAASRAMRIDENSQRWGIVVRGTHSAEGAEQILDPRSPSTEWLLFYDYLVFLKRAAN
jgi:hypothetical protein